MAKKKKSEDEELNEMIAKEQNPDHFEPQKEKGAPAIPEAVDPSHLEPQADETEKKEVNVSDPKHLKPQE